MNPKNVFNQTKDRKQFLINMIMDEWKVGYTEAEMWAERVSRLESFNRYYREYSTDKDKAKEEEKRKEYSTAEDKREYLRTLQRKAQEALQAKEPNLQLL